MKKRFSIYLAGGIKKQHESGKDLFWTEKEISVLRNGLDAYEVLFLDPASRSDNMADQLSVFGRDALMVSSCDLVFVDARDRRGIGVGAEMMWAKVHHIPVLTWAPIDSFYHQSSATVLNITVKDWVHPFVYALSDQIVHDLAEGITWIKKFLTHELPIKGIEFVEKAMDYYQETQLNSDIPMQELLAKNRDLLKK